MMNVERRNGMQLADAFGQLNRIVSPGIINRVMGLGGEIPEKGPGRYCIPRALRTQAEYEREEAERKRTRAQGIRFPQTKSEREIWNQAHQMRKR